ncbi:MAG: helix-turn-helix domain-containing protein [Clostridia bacterium]|nr:helix-turn-helix domain-containing protein [Clostridia bacterium]
MVKIQYKIFSQLLYNDFNIGNIKVAKSFFKSTETADYIKNGRKQNLLHLITSGEREYKFKDRTIKLKKGAVLFIPDNTYYLTTSYDIDDISCGGIGICFDIFDPDGNIIYIEPDIYYEWGERKEKATDYFESINNLYKYSPEAFTLKITILKLLHTLAKTQSVLNGNYSLLEPALNFIAEHYNENLSVSQYAKLCKISESHFRKKFTECMGISPIDYRNEIRFRKAKLLYQKNYTLQEIAEKVGFSDASYLSKMYKRHTGTSLKADSEIV